MALKIDNSRVPASSPDVPKRQILLIDDDQDMAEMLAEYLTPEGYAVHLAYTAHCDAGACRLNGKSHAALANPEKTPNTNTPVTKGNQNDTQLLFHVNLQMRDVGADKNFGRLIVRHPGKNVARTL